MGSLESTKAAAFYQKAKNCLLDTCWIAEETSVANASNVASQISRYIETLSKTECFLIIPNA